MAKRVYVVAGELSGDLHGTLLLTSLLDSVPGLEVRGVGGPNLHEKSQGCIRDWMDRAAVMGIWEVLKNYRWFRRQFFSMLDEVRKFQPHVLLLIDYPGFNIRFAKAARKVCPGIRIIQYVCPQVWAWNKARIPVIERVYDEVLCLFPFERSLFSNKKLKTTFIGHPLVDEINKIEKSIKVEDQFLVGLFPGSREREVSRLLPLMLEVVGRLEGELTGLSFEIPAATPPLKRMIEIALTDRGLSDRVVVTDGGSHELMQRAVCGVVASGTATLEAACFGLPYCLVYQVAPVTYWLAKCLVRIRWIGIVNILAQREVVREFIQGQANPELVTAELTRLLRSEEARRSLRSELRGVVDLLGAEGVHERAAAAVAKWFIAIPED